MSFPAPSTPTKQWLYVSDAVTAYLGNNTTVNWNPTGVNQLLCYAYAQGYTGLVLYQVGTNSNFYTGGTTFTTAGTNKLRDFLSKATAKNIEIAIASSTKPGLSDAMVDFNSGAPTGEGLVALFTENEFWHYSFNKTAQQAGTGTYSCLSMKANLLAKKISLNAAGIKIWGYFGWTHDYHYAYSTPYNIILVDQGARTFSIAGNHSAEFLAGMDIKVVGSTGNDGFYTVLSSVFSLGLTEITVSQAIPDGTGNGSLGSDVVVGGSELQVLNGAIDVFGLHVYTRTPSYSYAQSRARQFNFPADVAWIVSGESDQVNATGGFDTNSNFEGHFFQGQSPTSPYAQLYARKNVYDAYKYITINTDSLGYTPPQTVTTPKYFNAETDANVIANVNVVGIIVFSTRFMIPMQSGDGPRIYVNAGNDIYTTGPTGAVGFGGVACDDGLPVGSTLTYLWTIQSGPSGGVITNPTTLNPDFDFIASGTYVLRLTVTDGTVTSYDEVTVYVDAVPTTKTLTIDSQNPASGVSISVSIADINGDQDGVTSFVRYYDSAETPSFTAPLTQGLNTFQKWLQDGVDFSFSNILSVNDSSDHTFTAVYIAPVSSDQVYWVDVTANQPGTTYTVSQTDIYGNPVGFGGTIIDNLFYYINSSVTFTYPSIHPVTGQTLLGISVSRNGVGIGTFPGNTYTVVFDANYYLRAKYDENTPSPLDYFSASVYGGVAACSGGTYTILAQVQSPGTFTYLWSTGETTPSIQPPVGTYTCLITCTGGATYAHMTMFFDSIEVSAPIALVVDFDVVDALCGSPAGGRARAIVTGGLSPYTYLWSTGATTDFIDEPAGTYNVTVTDANGCTTKAPVTIGSQSGVEILDAVVTNVLCNGGSTGSINITTAGGALPLSFGWTKSGSPTVYPDTNNLTGLDAGTYYLIITDANSCTTSALPYVVTEPSAISFNIKISGGATCTNSDLTLEIENLVNAVAPVTYRWSDGSTGSTLYLGFLTAGPYIYGCEITDANGCSVTEQISFAIYQAPSVAPVVTLVTAPSFCTGTNYSLSVSGTGAFTSFIWVPTGDTTTTITHLSNTITVPTDFYVIAYDAFGCQIESNHVTVNPANNVIITVVAVVDNACAGSPTSGSITIAVSGGCPGYTYAWTGPGGFSATTQKISGLISGNYTVVVTDTHGNIYTDTITVGISSPTITAVVTNAGCPGTNTGSIDVTVTGGTAPYTYAWSNGATTPDISNLSVGAYSLLVTDDNGCTDTATFIISSSGSPVLLSFSYTNPTEGNANGVISVTATGGTPPYTYLWSTGDTTRLINNLAPETYTVTVNDSNGCAAIGSVNLFDNIQEEIEELNCCAGQMGYKYVWQMTNGLEDKAECTMHNLILLHGYISDLCNYVSGTCLSSDQIQSIIQKAKQICGCCDCGSDIYDDTILN